MDLSSGSGSEMEEGEAIDSDCDEEVNKYMNAEKKTEAPLPSSEVTQDGEMDKGKQVIRFGVKQPDERMEVSDELKDAYTSLGLSEEDLINSRGHHRFDCLHMYVGGGSLKSSDIYEYFKDFPQPNVERINTTTSNVVWFDSLDPDDSTATKAMLKFSCPIVGWEDYRKKKDGVKDGSQMDEMDTDSKEAKVADDSVHISELKMTIPPGRWRLGIPHPNCESVLLRYATRHDRKVEGAERFSDVRPTGLDYDENVGITTERYRQKRFNNPWASTAENWFGGPRGYRDWDKPEEEYDVFPVQMERPRAPRDLNVSLTTRQRVFRHVSPLPRPSRAERKRGYQSVSGSSTSSSSSSDSSDVEWTRRLKRPRMKMHADEEEMKKRVRQKQQRRRFEEMKDKRDLRVHISGSGAASEDLREKLGRRRETERNEMESSEGEGLSDDVTWALEDEEEYGDMRRNLDKRPVDLRSKLNSLRRNQTRARAGTQRSPLRIEVDNDEYYKLIGSDSE